MKAKIVVAALVSFVASVALFGASVPGSTIPIVDNAGAKWTVVGGVVQKNGANAGFSANVINLTWCNSVIYQENSSAQWWAWTGTTWGASTTPTNCGTSSSSSSSSGSSTSSSSSSSSSSSGGVFGVKVCGSKLCSTKDGSQVTLIGGTMSGCETNFAPARCPIIANTAVSYWQTTWKTQHAGTNAVRDFIDACGYLALPCAAGGNTGTAAAVQKAVAQQTAAGLYIILVEAWDAPAGQMSTGQPGFPSTANSPALWKALADKYGNQPNIIFEVFNEPFGENVFADWGGKDIPVMVNGGDYTPFCQQLNQQGNKMSCNAGVTYPVQGTAQTLALIRAEGAKNIVLLPTTGWNGEIEHWLAANQILCNADPAHNCAAAQHAYGYTGGQAPLSAVMAAGFPLIETEFQVAVGSIGTTAQILGLGVSGLFACCPHNWGGTGITLQFGYGPNYTQTW